MAAGGVEFNVIIRENNEKRMQSGLLAARPFLKPAATEHSAEYGAFLKAEVDKI